MQRVKKYEAMGRWRETDSSGRATGAGSLIMPEIVEVSFKGNRRAYYAAQDDHQLNDYVIVEADRGEDLGRVTAAGAVAERKCSGCSTGCAAPTPELRVLRLRPQRRSGPRGRTARRRAAGASHHA